MQCFLFIILFLLLLCTTASDSTCERIKINSHGSDRVIEYPQTVPQLPKMYYIVGPFPDGMRELGSDILFPFGSIFGIPLPETPYDSAFNLSYPSEISYGCRANWSVAYPDSNNLVTVEFPNVNWDYLTTPFG